MNFSMTCIVLLSILSMSSGAAVPSGGAGSPGKSALTKGGAAGGAEAPAPASTEAGSPAGDGASKKAADPAAKADKKKTAAMIMETVSKGLGAGGLLLSSKITEAVGSGLKA